MANKKGGKNVKAVYKEKAKKKNKHIASEETRKQAKSSVKPSIKKAADTTKDVFTPKKSTSSGKIETNKKETGQRKSTTTRNERSGNSNVARSGAIAAANVAKDAYKKNTEKANNDVKNGKKVVSSHYGDVYNENTDAVISKKDTKKAQDKFGTGKGLTGGAVKGGKSAYDKSKGAQDNLEKAGKKTIETKTKDEKEEAAKQQRIYNWKHGGHSSYAQMYDWLVENGGNVDGLSKKDWVEKQRLDTKDDRQKDAELAVEESSKFSYTKAPVSTDQMMKQYNASLFANNSVKTKTNDDNYVKDKKGNIKYAFSWDKDGNLKMTPKTKGKTKVDTTQASNIMDYYNGAFNKKGQLTNQDASTKIADQRAGWIHDSPAAAGFMQGMGYADIRKGIGQFSDAAVEDVNKITMEGGMTSAWNLGYMGGFVTQMGIGGVNSMAKSLTKAGAFKTARGALAATAAKSAAIETPVNILDSIKMATDANGNTNYKAAAGYMALNTLMSGGIPAIMEGAGGLIKKHESKELLGLLAKEQELAKVGRSLPESDMAKYDKLVGRMTKAVEDQMSAASVIAGKTLDDVAKSSPDGFIKVAQAQVKANAGAVENSLKKVKNLKDYDGGLTDGELKAKGMYRNANGEVETKVVQLESAEDIVKAEALKDHYAKAGNAKKVMEMEQALSNARVSKQGDEIFESARQMQREQFAKDVMKKADVTDERSAVKYVDDVSNAVKNKAYIDGKDMEGLRAAIEHAKQTQNDALLKSAEGTLREAKKLLQAEAKALERRFKPLTKKTGGNIVVGTSEDLAKVLADNGKTIPEGRLVNGFRVGNDIYVNIESPERHSFTIAHELTHIMEDNAESFGELINLVKKFDEKAWADELKSVSEVYSGVTDDFEKEVAGNVLGKLIADQDFLHTLYKKDANLFQKICDFLRTVVTGTDDGFTVPKEYEDIYNAWDKALNELGKKKAGNVDLSIIPEGHTKGISSAKRFEKEGTTRLNQLKDDLKNKKISRDEFERGVAQVHADTGWSLTHGGENVFNVPDSEISFKAPTADFLSLGDIVLHGSSADVRTALSSPKYAGISQMFPSGVSDVGIGVPVRDLFGKGNKWLSRMGKAFPRNGEFGGRIGDTIIRFRNVREDAKIFGTHTIQPNSSGKPRDVITLNIHLLNPKSEIMKLYRGQIEERFKKAMAREAKAKTPTEKEDARIEWKFWSNCLSDDKLLVETRLKESFLHENTHTIQRLAGLEEGGSNAMFYGETKLPAGGSVERSTWSVASDVKDQDLLDSLNLRRGQDWQKVYIEDSKANGNTDASESALGMSAFFDKYPQRVDRNGKDKYGYFLKSEFDNGEDYAKEMVSLLRDGKGKHISDILDTSHKDYPEIKKQYDAARNKIGTQNQDFWNAVGEAYADEWRAHNLTQYGLQDAKTSAVKEYRRISGERTARAVQEALWRKGDIDRFYTRAEMKTNGIDIAGSTYYDDIFAGAKDHSLNVNQFGKNYRKPKDNAEGVLIGTKWTTGEADKAHPQNNFDYSLSSKKAKAEVDRIAEEVSSKERRDMANAVKEYEALQKERDALPSDISAVDRFEEIEEKMENLFKSQEEYETAVETLEKSASEEVDAIAKANESDAKVKKMLDDYRPISESLKEYGIEYTTSGKVYKIEGIGEYKMRKKGEFPAYYTRSLHDDSWVRITPEALHNNLMTAKRVNGSNKVEVPTQNKVDVPTKEAKPVTRETADDFDEFTADGKPKTETPVKESAAKDVAETTAETTGRETAEVTPKEAVALAKKSPSKEEYNATAIRMHDDAVSKYGTREEVREMINKNLMDSVKYNGKSAKEAEAQATKELKEIGFTELKKKYLEADFNDDPKILVARWNKLAEYIDKQIDAGKDAAEWYAHREEIDLKCTQISNFAGRGTQAMKDILTSTRTGRLRVVENEIKKLQRQYHTRIDGDLTIDNELLERLAEAEGAEKEELLHEINKQLWEQIPASLIERINEYRHCFMLFNVKTHGRNIIGNGAFRLARAVSDYSEAKMLQSNAVKRIAEKKGIKDLQVDKVPVSYAKDVKPNAEHLDTEFKAIYEKSNSKNKYIEMGRPDDVPVVKWKPMQKLIKANYHLLEKEDLKGALKPAFDRAYVSWCKARLPEGKSLAEFMSEMTDAQKNKARHYALTQGEYATFRDSCAFSDWLIGRKQTFAGKQGKTMWGTMGYRALDIALEGAIPFVKTPVNIFRRSVDFSPFGLLRGVTNVVTAKNETAFKTAIHDISTGMTGTAMCGFGAFLAAEGFVTVKAGEKSGDAYYDRDMGFQDYSINVGGHSWTLDWAQPMQMSFFAGAAFIKGLGDGWSPQEALNMFFAVSSPLTDTSFMSSPKDTIGRFVENAGRGTDEKETDFAGALAQLIAGDMPKNYISGMIPQLVAQTAGFTDVYNFDKNKTLGENFKAYGKAFVDSGQIQRDTRGTAENAFIRGWQSAGRQLLNKVPVLRQMYLNPKLDRRGNDKVSESTKSDWNIAIRLANAFANPASVKEITFDKTDKELINIRNHMDKGSKDYKYFYYNFTGNPSYNLADVKGFRGRQMTYDEAYTYGKANRIKQNTMIEDMINAKSYKGMTWSMKADEVNDAHWVGTTVADLKTYGANYAVRSLLKNNDGEKDDFTNYKTFKGTGEATNKAFVEYFIEKETMLARAHCDTNDIYNIKAAIAIRKGDKELLSALDIQKGKEENISKYIRKMRKKATQSGEKLKKLIFDDITDFTCSAASHIDAAGVNSSTSAKSLALGICAADGDKKAELTYRGMGYTWNKAQAGGGLALKYGVNGKKGDEALAELTKIKAEVRRNDPDGSGSYTKEDVTTYIDKKMKNASADEKACMFESLSNGNWKNPYKAEINDHLKWGKNRDGEWGNGKSGHGGGHGWGHGHGGGGGSGKGKMPKTDSGAIKGKVSNPFSNTGKPSNLDDAYRKKLKKLREQTR